jgi:GPH family glycoside/pentoside/hexuronide:cation symporter
VLSWVGFNASHQAQTPLAEQGILWLVTLIPAALYLLSIFIIGRYELSDAKMEQINKEITDRELCK